MVRRRVTAALAGPVVLDSSCWLEFFADTERAALFAPALARPAALVVPVITIYEVVKKLARDLGDEVASEALALMRQGVVIELDLALSLAATRHSLPLADSLIYATSLAHGAELWTQDAHFEGLPGVRFFAKATA
ncbi:MAG: type II toxin-antitoxin system VapC family toxin [Rubrivivax sp.]|jgi:predicted nucleic acid-binding protein|nr:type II toxin-antitoxin system VapC family toxin [Rubrivivax sp.]